MMINTSTLAPMTKPALLPIGGSTRDSGVFSPIIDGELVGIGVNAAC
jgi:hypothetical protein